MSICICGGEFLSTQREERPQQREWGEMKGTDRDKRREGDTETPEREMV